MTASERKARFNALASLGCVVCRIHNGSFVEACIHHLTGIKYRATGKKASDEHTIGLCHDHHQGAQGIHTLGMRSWEQMFGTQEYLLDYSDRLLRVLK